jgi:glycosyltransferase involved in cell wall biosynthesis
MVATDAPGCREIAIDGETALTVPVDDAAALAAAMAKLAGDAELKKRLGANARALVERKFSAEAIGRETVAVYDRLIAARRRSRPASS